MDEKEVNNPISSLKDPPMVFKRGAGLLSSSTIGLKIIIVFAVIFILNCIGGLFVWNLYDNKSKELDSLKRQLRVQAIVDETNSKLKELIDRETNLYPKLQAQKDSLIIANNKLDDIQAKIGLVGKDKFNAEVSKMDINALSNYLNEHGYSNTITSCGK